MQRRHRSARAGASEGDQSTKPRKEIERSHHAASLLRPARPSYAVRACVDRCHQPASDREWLERDNRRTGRRVQEAKLPVTGAIEEVVPDAARGLDKSVLRSLATCSWIRAKQNVILLTARHHKVLLGARDAFHPREAATEQAAVEVAIELTRGRSGCFGSQSESVYRWRASTPAFDAPPHC